MFDTAFTLGMTQIARSMSFPERLQQHTGRNATLEGWRIRNTGMDALYYDIKCLSAEEVFYLSDSLAAEGLILIVPPKGGPMLTICESIDEYVLRGGRDVTALAVAGIGGSALGAAAFARNVADAIGAPVAAVVSGFGLGDLVNEAMGGAFLFGWLGGLRHQCERIDNLVGRPRIGAHAHRGENLPVEANDGCLDVDTVGALLGDSRLGFRLLASHSRGSLVLADALQALCEGNPSRAQALGEQARVVTFGARLPMPPAFTRVTSVIGEYDWFGELNSRQDIATGVKVPFGGHSTNTDMPGGLPVTKTLKAILAHDLPVVDTSSHALVAASAPIPFPPPRAVPAAVPMAVVEAPAPMVEPAETLEEAAADENSDRSAALDDEAPAAQQDALIGEAVTAAPVEVEPMAADEEPSNGTGFEPKQGTARGKTRGQRRK